MFRTVSAFAIVSLVVVIALRVAFGVLGGVVGLLFGLAWLTLKLLCIGGIIYFTLSVVSPASARRIREFLGIDDESPRAS